MNLNLLADAVAFCALELSEVNQVRGDFEESIHRIVEATNPRFLTEMKSAARIANNLSAEKIGEIRVRKANESLLDFLTTNTLENLRDSEVKTRGAVHTPLWISTHITRNALRWWKRQNPRKEYPSVVGDLSAGVGSFLLALHLEGIDSKSKVIGMDSNRHSVLCCELLRIVLGAEWEIYHADSLIELNLENPLSSGGAAEFKGLEFDVLVGNPPYVRSSNLAPEYSASLRKGYQHLGSGSFDLSLAFLEQAGKLLRPSGLFSYITSSKFTNSKYGESACEWLSKESRVLSIEHFADSQVFPGFTTYVLILTVSNARPAKRFQFTSFEHHNLDEALSSVKSQTLQTKDALVFPWTFMSDEFLGIRKKLADANLPLLTKYFSGIFQGVRTGANEVFVVSQADAKDLEPELLIPFVSGREIKRQALSHSRNFLIFPYQIDEFRRPTLLSEQELAKDFEKIHNRLSGHKNQLVERSLDDKAEWFGYSRSQSLSSFLRPKIFVKEMMPRAEFAYDAEGRVAFGSGYALDASFLPPEDISMWTAVLNTPVLEFSLRNLGTQLHSGWFRVLKHQLIKLRLPIFSAAQTAQLKKLVANLEMDPNGDEGDRALKSINALVAEAFGLSNAEIEKITDFLATIHARSTPSSKLSIAASKEQTHDYEPVKLEKFNKLHIEKFEYQQLVTFRNAKKAPIHSWYPYTQGFDEKLVLETISDFGLQEPSLVLDPFGGVGTTALACRKAGMKCISNDVSPLVTWISKVKNSDIDVGRIRELLASQVLKEGDSYAIKIHLNPTLFASFFENAFPPEVLDKVLRYLSFIRDMKEEEATRDFLSLMLLGRLESMSNIRKHGSHYRYLNSQTSVGLEKLNIPLFDAKASVYEVFEEAVQNGIADLEHTKFALPSSSVRSILGNSKYLDVETGTVDAVITSPPYLNRNNYIAQQKGELALLGFIQDSLSYKQLVKSTLISHVEGTLPSSPDSIFPEINKIVENINLTEGNNPKIPFMIAGYFEDMNVVFQEMWRVCKPGAKLAFVVGNTRWGGVVIPVDHLLMQQAEAIGFIPQKILVTRYKGNSPQQMRRFGRIPVRESIIIFSKP